MKKIAFVTDDIQTTLSASDQRLEAPLAKLNIAVEAVSWQSANARWEDYNGVILRSCWNYHSMLAPFQAWLAHLEQTQVNLWNRPAVVKWNLDKRYIADLSNCGVNTPQTLFFEGGKSTDLAMMLKQMNWQEAILKPCVGASAHHIERVDIQSLKIDQEYFDHKLAQPDKKWLLQEFIPEIANGEWSFIFFTGRFSHAVVKTPKAGNIFVQNRMGGSTAAGQPSDEWIFQAKNILNKAADFLYITAADLLYARVDVIPRNNHLCLMELELIEPGLFLDLASDQSIEQFAKAIAGTIEA